MLDTKLIENALSLCEYMYDDFTDEIYRWDSYSFSWEYCWPKIEQKFSIEKFCYYLLSPCFIEKYQENCINDFESYTDIVLSELFWRALYLYQLWQKHHLIELLSKIK